MKQLTIMTFMQIALNLCDIVTEIFGLDYDLMLTSRFEIVLPAFELLLACVVSLD